MTIYTPREEGWILNCMHKTADNMECDVCVNRIGLYDIPTIFSCPHAKKETE